MSNTVKIYNVTITQAYMMSEQGTGFSLNPWGKNTMYYSGYDDGGKDYILPDGYELAESNSGEMHIYNAEGEYCTLVNKFDCPILMTSNEEIMLKKLAQG